MDWTTLNKSARVQMQKKRLSGLQSFFAFITKYCSDENLVVIYILYNRTSVWNSLIEIKDEKYEN